jgi:archaetidylinositol phosphate synthase
MPTAAASALSTGDLAVNRPARMRRYHKSLTAHAEKRLLIWMAARLPRAVNSDHLTMLGFASSLGVAGAFALTPHVEWAPLAVVPLLVLNWFGDSLDGTLARVRNQQRPRFGYYVDHVIDVVGMAAIGAGLAMSGLMTPVLGLGVALAYVLLAAESFLATHSVGTFRMSFGLFGPTELRIVLAAGAVKAAFSPWVVLAGFDIRLFDVGGAVAIAGMLGVLLATAARNTRTLFHAEPLPEGSARERRDGEGSTHGGTVE